MFGASVAAGGWDAPPARAAPAHGEEAGGDEHGDLVREVCLDHDRCQGVRGGQPIKSSGRADRAAGDVEAA